MTSREENELLTRTGPGTPCGELMRRYWQPVGLSAELPEGCAPVPSRVLAEDLVLFRDQTGRPGLLGLHCSHRGADLSYGRLEDGGVRCIYHGWLYDVAGRCLDQPGEPAGSTFHERIHHTAYPCVEAGGIILAYLGPGEPPLLPGYEFLDAPPEFRFVTRYLQECNYLQSNEGNMDQTHVSFLHRRVDDPSSYLVKDLAPTLDTEETDFGFRMTAMRRLGGGELHVTVSNFLIPNGSAFNGGLGPDGYSVHLHVPIDDEHHWKYVYRFRRTTPLPERQANSLAEGVEPDGRLARNRGNRYLQDREDMRSHTFAGLSGFFHAEDACVTESAPIQDRTREHPAYSDRGVLLMRQILLRAIEDVASGREPLYVQRDPARNRFPDLVANAGRIRDDGDWPGYWKHPPKRQSARSA